MGVVEGRVEFRPLGAVCEYLRYIFVRESANVGMCFCGSALQPNIRTWRETCVPLLW